MFARCLKASSAAVATTSKPEKARMPGMIAAPELGQTLRGIGGIEGMQIGSHLHGQLSGSRGSSQKVQQPPRFRSAHQRDGCLDRDLRAPHADRGNQG